MILFLLQRAPELEAVETVSSHSYILTLSMTDAPLSMEQSNLGAALKLTPKEFISRGTGRIALIPSVLDWMQTLQK